MSTGTRISLASAASAAREFHALFDGCATRWEFAGSVRRGVDYVGDIEHVVMPRDVAGADLFASPVSGLWRRLDELLADGIVTQALYTNTTTGAVSPRWGERMRGVMYRGNKHEIWAATAENWGAILLIRTGPWQYSQSIVAKFLRDGIYRQHLGFLRRVIDDSIVSVPTEQDYCRLAGVRYLPPAHRVDRC